MFSNRVGWVPVHAAQPSHGLSQWYQSPGDQRWKSIKIGNGAHHSRDKWGEPPVRKPPKIACQKILPFLIYSVLKSMESYDWARRTRCLWRHGLLGGGSPISENGSKKVHPPSICNSHVLDIEFGNFQKNLSNLVRKLSKSIVKLKLELLRKTQIFRGALD